MTPLTRNLSLVAAIALALVVAAGGYLYSQNVRASSRVDAACREIAQLGPSLERRVAEFVRTSPKYSSAFREHGIQFRIADPATLGDCERLRRELQPFRWNLTRRLKPTRSSLPAVGVENVMGACRDVVAQTRAEMLGDKSSAWLAGAMDPNALCQPPKLPQTNARGRAHPDGWTVLEEWPTALEARVRILRLLDKAWREQPAISR